VAPSRSLIFVSVMVGTFMSTLDSGSVYVALPTIAREFDANLDQMQWVILASAICVASFVAIAGRISDLLGRTRMFLWGYIFFLTGACFSGMAWNVASLAVFRIITSLGIAFLTCNSQAILVNVFPSRERGRAMGLNDSTVYLGFISGPVVGGLLTAAVGWRSIFYVPALLATIGYIMGRIYLPRTLPSHREHFDLTSPLLFATGSIFFLVGLGGIARGQWLSLSVGGLTVLGAGLIVAFAWWQGTSTKPLIPPIVFRSPAVAYGYLAGFLSFAAINTSNFLTPFVAQRALGIDARTTGFIMAAAPITSVFVSGLSGHLSDRFGSRPFTVAGLLSTATGLFLLSGAARHWSPIDLGWRLGFIGLGQGLFSAPNIATIHGSVPLSLTGVTSSLQATIRNFAFSVSAAAGAATFIFGAHGHTNSVAYLEGYSVSIGLAMFLALVGVIPSLLSVLPSGIPVRKEASGV
jgi:EmrB/QacA subfamily drug resistance transporter